MVQPNQIVPLRNKLLNAIGVIPNASSHPPFDIDQLVPHPLLRRTLLNDPAMAALLPGLGCHFSVGGFEHFPFFVHQANLVFLSPSLLPDPLALAAAGRWGAEAAEVVRIGLTDEAAIWRISEHGKALLCNLPEATLKLLLSGLAPSVATELLHNGKLAPSKALVQWISGLVPQLEADNVGSNAFEAFELHLPVENLIAAGGDSRLVLNSENGRNRYGVPARPRPEAIHFSSSTASAVSDYGFLLCDLMRREMLEGTRETERDSLKSSLATAIGQSILDLLGLSTYEADVAVAPSGTDTEWLGVLISRAAASGKLITNILISPEESGRGVKLAGGGQYFDKFTIGAESVVPGTPLWNDNKIEVVEVPIRSNKGQQLETAYVDALFLAAGAEALNKGHRVLAHVLLSSKTGLNAPGFDVVRQLVGLAPDNVDVIVDACQMRTNLLDLGPLVREGWMVQISGSKFLTGPPFSGALVIPARIRGRAAYVGAELRTAPALGHRDYWTAGWRSQMCECEHQVSFGPLYRWLPALIEAELLSQLSDDLILKAFDRFCDAVTVRISSSNYLLPIDQEGQPLFDDWHSFAKRSIMSFEVFGKSETGDLVRLGEDGCRQLFELLNEDVSNLFSGLTYDERVLAQQPVHLGQPVTLGQAPHSITVLRMVLGARFFNIVGHAGKDNFEAALQSEIYDAIRAIAKIDLLSSHWWHISQRTKAA